MGEPTFPKTKLVLTPSPSKNSNSSSYHKDKLLKKSSIFYIILLVKHDINSKPCCLLFGEECFIALHLPLQSNGYKINLHRIYRHHFSISHLNIKKYFSNVSYKPVSIENVLSLFSIFSLLSFESSFSYGGGSSLH